MQRQEDSMEVSAEVKISAQQIASTIKAQIMAGDYWALARMGGHSYAALGPNPEGSMGGLQFKVNGSKIKGWVIVRLKANDTYTVTAGRVRRGLWLPVAKVEDVYCDNLAAVIEEMVG
jgi:hypothetical protein